MIVKSIIILVSIAILAKPASQSEKYEDLDLLRNKIVSLSSIFRQKFLNLSPKYNPTGPPDIIASNPLQKPDKRARTIANTYSSISPGQLKGSLVETNRSNQAYIYLGVPYAQTPSGPLRFKKPEPALPWQGIYDATYYRAACPQNSTLPTATTEGYMSEDCLQLNIILSTKCTASTPCPLIYYIHGGQYSYDTPVAFPIDALINNFASNGVAIITVGMRLGSLGFWTTNNDQALGNWGVYDAILGLEWVQKEGSKLNIDTNRVSIMGHSSGSDIVSFLAISPKTSRLFHQVIEMSGSPISPSGIDTELGVQRSQMISRRLGCTNNSTPWTPEQDYSPIIDCMQNVDWRILIDVQKQMEIEGFAQVGVRLDGVNGLFPLDAVKLSNSRRVYPMLIGSVKHEADGIAMAITSQEADKSMLYILCNSGIGYFRYADNIELLTKACVSAYSKTNMTVNEQVGDIINQLFIFIATYKDASSMVNAGGTVYLYSFDYEKSGYEGIAPWHAMDLTYIMGLHPFPFDARDYAIDDIYVKLFTNFAKFANPTAGYSTAEQWKPLIVQDYNYYSVDLPRGVNKRDYHRTGLTIWNEIIPNVDRQLDNRSLLNEFGALQLAVTETKNGTKKDMDQKIDFETAFWISIVISLCLLLTLVISAMLHICKRRKERAMKDFHKRRHTLQPSEKTQLLSGATSTPEIY